MKRALIGAALLALAAACGQQYNPKGLETNEAVAAPTNLKDLSDSLDQMGLALLVMRQVKEAPGGPRGCDQVWNTQDMGAVPANALTASPFASHVGARVFSIHCDAAGATRKDDGTGQWLVFLPADSMTASVVPCVAQAGAENVCFKNIPTNPA